MLHKVNCLRQVKGMNNNFINNKIIQMLQVYLGPYTVRKKPQLSNAFNASSKLKSCEGSDSNICEIINRRGS